MFPYDWELEEEVEILVSSFVSWIYLAEELDLPWEEMFGRYGLDDES